MSNDLSTTNVPLAEQIACVERHLKHLHRVLTDIEWPGEFRDMSRASEIKLERRVMGAVLATLQALEEME